MSYIHEALNKAQRERESRYRRYGIASARAKETRFFDKRAARVLSLIVLTILIAFALYSWLDCIIPKKGAVSEFKDTWVVAAHNPESVVTIEGFYEKARELHKKGDFQEAIDMYKRILEADPGHINTLNNLGVIYFHLNDLALASASFEKAIRLNPEYVNSYYNLACLYARSGELPESLAVLKKAISLDQSVREWAQSDADMKNLHKEKEFKDLMGGQSIRNKNTE